MDWLQLPWQFLQQVWGLLGKEGDGLNVVCWVEDEISMALLLFLGFAFIEDIEEVIQGVNFFLGKRYQRTMSPTIGLYANTMKIQPCELWHLL